MLATAATPSGIITTLKSWGTASAFDRRTAEYVARLDLASASPNAANPESFAPGTVRQILEDWTRRAHQAPLHLMRHISLVIEFTLGDHDDPTYD